MSSDHSELVTQFCGVTGVDADRAKFHLESAAWKISVALASFYDDDDGDNFEPEIIEPEQDEVMQVESDSKETKPNEDKKSTKSTSRFATLNTLGSGNSSDEEEGQAFYAGGSENSGQQIIGPSRKKPQDLIKELLTSAQAHGAETIDRIAESDQASGSSAFGGHGFTLGATSSDSKLVKSSKEKSNLPPVDVVLKLWQNGFSVNDGPLRDFEDQKNKDEIPQELIKEAKGQEINLDMEDHKSEVFRPPKHALKAFSGQGHVLGSPSAEVVATHPPSEPIINVSSVPAISVNESEPTTNIQLRLADGSRLVVKLNHNHTIQDIRNYIIMYPFSF
ncbi:NSFL1 cofactor p47 [Nymphon striatum]|nr:NSFL1 cofactor p47 [Nymphon striatum]